MSEEIDEIGSHIGNGGQFDPTDPALRLAREIAEDHGCLHDADIVAAIHEGIRRASELEQERRPYNAARHSSLHSGV